MAAGQEISFAELASQFDQYDKDGSGFIGVDELRDLCEELGQKLSDDELQDALTVLDKDQSGKIEKKEFVYWWTNAGQGGNEGDAAAGSVQKKLNKIANTGRGKLLKAKMMRKQAESDAQLLANRIALLQQEEAKAWKKIQQTKTRANEIMKLREDNDVKTMMKSQRYQQSDAQTRMAQEQKLIQKQRAKANRDKAIHDKQMKSREEVDMVKELRRRNLAEKEEQRRQQLKQAKESAEQIRIQHRRALEKKEQQRREQERQNQIAYENRVKEEERACQITEMEVQVMEREEMELIQRLQNAQFLQKQAYDELEGALSGSPSSRS